MECPYCGSELEHHDVFGYLALHQSGEIEGDIFICPVGREDGSCPSALFNVAGSFYSFRGSTSVLYDGYPC